MAELTDAQELVYIADKLAAFELTTTGMQTWQSTLRRIAAKLERVPSDQEIEEQATLHFEPGTHKGIWIGACKWFRDKIEGK